MQAQDAAKLGFIRAYFDEEGRKVAALTQLAGSGYGHEALVLCLVYIDRLAQKLCWPSDKTGHNFVRSLTEFGMDPELRLIHPKQLVSALQKLSAGWQLLAGVLEQKFPGPSYELLPLHAFESSVAGPLTPQQLTTLRAELWRGTIAATAYYWLRNPAVHGVGPSPQLTFSNTTVAGSAARPLNLERLTAALTHLLAEARRRSESTNQWYGDDRALA
jgi:hypothetical protein